MIPKKLHNSWVYPEMDNILERVNKEIAKDAKVLCPSGGDIFNAFEMPLCDVKVVVLGLSPYPDGQSANGYAFAINQGQEYPYALRSIVNSFGPNAEKYFDETFTLWKNQGFLLLNTALTCRKGEPNSHIKVWHEFTLKTLSHLVKNNSDVIFYLCGKVAWEMFDKVRTLSKLNLDSVYVLHPSSTYYSGGTWDGYWSLLDDKYRMKFGKQIDFILPF